MDINLIITKIENNDFSSFYYNKIIENLKKFVFYNEPLVKTIYVYENSESGYTFLDIFGRDYTEKCYKEYKKYINSNEENLNDFLLDALITISPQKIILNCEIASNLYKTIKKIFSDVKIELKQH